MEFLSNCVVDSQQHTTYSRNSKRKKSRKCKLNIIRQRVKKCLILFLARVPATSAIGSSHLDQMFARIADNYIRQH